MKKLLHWGCVLLGLGFGPATGAQVVSETGTPIPGARVRYARQQRYVAAKRIAGRPVSWHPAEAPVGGLLTTAVDGSFSLPTLPDGEYSICVWVPAGGYLDLCGWGVAVRFAVKQALVPPLGPIRLRKGALLRIRVNDPQRLLPPATLVSLSRLILGVRTATGSFFSAAVVKEDASGRDLALTVPFDTPLKLWVFSRHVKVTDETGRAVDTTGANIPLQVASTTPEVRFTFNVSGLQ